PHYSFFLPLHPPPPSTLFPYTTLFRSLHTLDLGGGAIEIRLIRTRIDHVKEVAFFDDSASLEVNLSNITGYARPDLNRLDRFEASGEFIPLVYLFLDRGNDIDRQRSLWWRGLFFASICRQQDRQNSKAN